MNEQKYSANLLPWASQFVRDSRWKILTAPVFCDGPRRYCVVSSLIITPNIQSTHVTPTHANKRTPFMALIRAFASSRLFTRKHISAQQKRNVIHSAWSDRDTEIFGSARRCTFLFPTKPREGRGIIIFSWVEMDTSHKHVPNELRWLDCRLEALDSCYLSDRCAPSCILF